MGDDRRDDGMKEINHRWAGRALATTKIAANAMRLASRRLLKREGATDGLIGEHLAKELDQMKGLAMKVGQILSYFDGALPAQTHAALRKLQKGAEPLVFDEIAPIVEAALGAPVDELFESFDRRAVAAASIGQVHRARFEDHAVAVKVQYPNVRQTFEADFARIGTIAKLASLAAAVDGPAIAEELRERVLEECDYGREADHQDAFRHAYRDDPRVTIPAVIRARSAETVLTTRWHEGDDLYRFVERASARERTEVGLTLAHFAYHSLFALGTLNADPHPGNYLFGAEGGVVFLDFGCIRRFEADYVERERAQAKVLVEGRRADFRDAAIATGMIPRPDKIDWDMHWAMMRHQYAPYLTPRFHFTKEFIATGMRYSQPDNPNLRHLAIVPPWIWQQRLQWGLHAVLARLDAEGPFADVLREALDAPLETLEVPAQERPVSAVERVTPV